MKEQKQTAARTWAERVTDTLLLLLLLFGASETLVTGFQLDVIKPLLHLYTVLLAFLLPNIRPRGKLAALPEWVLGGVLGAWLWFRFDTLWNGFRYEALSVYHYLCWGYGDRLPMPDFLQRYRTSIAMIGANSRAARELTADGTEFLLFLLAVYALLFAVLFLHNRHSKAAALLPLPGFVLCFLVIDTTLPSAVSLLCLLLYWALLLLSTQVRRLSPAAAAKQMLFCVLPVLLLFAGVSLLCPKETFERGYFRDHLDAVYHSVVKTADSAQKYSEQLLKSADLGKLLPWTRDAQVEGETISLDSMGKRRYTGRTVMTVTAEEEGTLYLRSNTYSDYNGKTWSEPEGRTAKINVFVATAQIMERQNVRKRPLTLEGARADTVFTPYYFSDTSAGYAVNGDRCLDNVQREDNYTVDYYDPESRTKLLLSAPGDPSMPLYAEELKTDRTVYTVPAETAAALQTIIDENGLDELGLWQCVSKVTMFVRNCAAYSLDTPAMPADEEDFAVWFLTKAESGYCTHFATAEVLLLRACGFPARLAVGYLIHAGTEPTAVLDSDAHAWAEVFDEWIGWVPVEATPAARTAEEADERSEQRPGGLPDAAASDIISGEKQETDTASSVPGTEQNTFETTVPEPGEKPGNESGSALTVGEDGEVITDKGKDGDKSGGGLQGSTSKTPPDILVNVKPQPFHLPWNYILPVLLACALVSALPVYRYQKLRYHRRRTVISDESRETVNRAALYWYGRCLVLARARGISVPEQLTVLAGKAKFSQHRLTGGELEAFAVWYRNMAAALRAEDGLFLRFRHYWIDVLY